MTRFMVAEEFSPSPGVRFMDDGDNSGEEFRERVLIPLVTKAIQTQEPIIFDFDYCDGMPTSFGEEAFGGLARKLKDVKASELDRLVKLEAPNTPGLWSYIQFARSAMLSNASR